MDDRYHGPLPRSKDDQELINDIMRNVEATLDEGSSYIDLMWAAYVRTTEIPPEDVALVQMTEPDGTIITYFARKQDLFGDMP